MNKKKENKIIKFPANISQVEREVEAILFASEEPLDEETIQSRIKTRADVLKILHSLADQYKNRGINLVCISNKWSFRTASNLSKLINLQTFVKKKLSKAAIETLEILLELNWVRPSGRKNVPGKPIQYITTEDFLSHFNLQKLSDLPNVEELTSAGLIDSGNVDTSIFGTGKFFKEQMDEKKENIYSNIDDMLSQSLKPEEE